MGEGNRVEEDRGCFQLYVHIFKAKLFFCKKNLTQM